jgi:hypothetical protein
MSPFSGRQVELELVGFGIRYRASSNMRSVSRRGVLQVPAGDAREREKTAARRVTPRAPICRSTLAVTAPDRGWAQGRTARTGRSQSRSICG